MGERAKRWQQWAAAKLRNPVVQGLIIGLITGNFGPFFINQTRQLKKLRARAPASIEAERLATAARRQEKIVQAYHDDRVTARIWWLKVWSSLVLNQEELAVFKRQWKANPDDHN